MLLTVVLEDGQTLFYDLEPSLEFNEFKEIVAAETGLQLDSFDILFKSTTLGPGQLKSHGLEDNELLHLRRHEQAQEDMVEMMRQVILNDPRRQAKLREANPELLDAALTDPSKFAILFQSLRRNLPIPGTTGSSSSSSNSMAETALSEQGQRKIEEAIRAANIAESLATAMEYHPESFGTVTMLYIACRVNGKELKAFVDCGAQTTIMTESCARHCGLMRLLDERFSGIAKGVGTSKILGRIHAVQLQLADLFLPCAVTVIEGDGPDMLLGLDMLKRYQCAIDLREHVLRVDGASIPFLPESEIPRSNE